MNYKEIDIDRLEEELLSEDSNYANFHQLWEPLSKFLMDYEHLKGLKKMTQNEIAVESKTTQSAISRLIRMKGKPTYTLLNKVSRAVGGKLFITPLADMAVTLPYDLHNQAIQLAESQQLSVSELMLNILRKSLTEQDIVSPSPQKIECNSTIEANNFVHKLTDCIPILTEKVERKTCNGDASDDILYGVNTRNEYELAV